jgi:hypothetical protein
MRAISEIAGALLLIGAAVIASVVVASIVYPALGIWRESGVNIRVGSIYPVSVNSNTIYIYGQYYTAPSSPIYVNTITLIVTNKMPSQIYVSVSSLVGLPTSGGQWALVNTQSGSIYIYRGIPCGGNNFFTIEPGKSLAITICILTTTSPLPKGLVGVGISCTNCDTDTYYITI